MGEEVDEGQRQKGAGSGSSDAARTRENVPEHSTDHGVTIRGSDEYGDAAPGADPVDALVGSVDVEPATVDAVVYPSKTP